MFLYVCVFLSGFGAWFGFLGGGWLAAYLFSLEILVAGSHGVWRLKGVLCGWVGIDIYVDCNLVCEVRGCTEGFFDRRARGGWLFSCSRCVSVAVDIDTNINALTRVCSRDDATATWSAPYAEASPIGPHQKPRDRTGEGGNFGRSERKWFRASERHFRFFLLAQPTAEPQYQNKTKQSVPSSPLCPNSLIKYWGFFLDDCPSSLFCLRV